MAVQKQLANDPPKKLRMLTLCALIAIGVSSVASAADTNALVVPSGAISIDGTCARIDAFLISTSQGGGAVWIDKALVRFTVHIWIALGVGKANAVGPVVPGFTNGVSATSGEKARILTFFPDAGLVVSTFIVTLAPSYTKRRRLPNVTCG